MSTRINKLTMAKEGYDNDLSHEETSTYISNYFTPMQILIIYRGFDDDLSMEQIALYAKPEFSAEYMADIEEGLDDGLSMEQISVYTKPGLSNKQKRVLYRGLCNGVPIDRMTSIANPELSPREMRKQILDEVEKEAIGFVVFITDEACEDTDIYYPSKIPFKFCRTKKDVIELIKENQQADYENNDTDRYSYSYRLITKDGDFDQETFDDQEIILAPSYEMAKTIKAEATVEAEYGDECVEGTMVTLAHHGVRSNNPAPCNTTVDKILPFATILVSHIDLDTLGGIFALQGIKPKDDDFWQAAEYIDVNGAHHIHELPQGIQDKLNAYYAYNAAHPRQRCTEVTDVTSQIDDWFDIIKSIIDEDYPMHDQLISDGKKWAESRSKEVEEMLVKEDKHLRVFDTTGIFCGASYYSPQQDVICDATIAYNEKFQSITLAFEDGGKSFNAREIVQSLWGPEAGGRAGIAGSPRNVSMSKDDLDALVNKVSQLYAEA